jgi:putative transposase
MADDEIFPSILTYKFRLLPTKAQHAELAAILETQRRLYNDALAERIDAYRRSVLEVERGRRAKPQTITFFDQTNSLTAIRNDPLTRDEFIRLPAFLQRWTLKRVDDAYKAFFRRVKAGASKAGFPRFRGRDYWDSFGSTVQGGNSPVSFDGRRVRIGVADLRIRVHAHRPLPEGALLKAAVFTRAAGGRKWHVSLQCVIPPAAVRRCQSLMAAVGIDVGVSTAIAQSDGVMVPPPHPGKRAAKAIRRAQRALARAKRGSKRRSKTRARLARALRTIADTRRGWAHKQAARLTRSYAMIGAEDLAIVNMTRSAKGTLEESGRNVAAKAGLNRAILDIAWSDLREKLAYKAARDGAKLILVDPRYTSQRCSGCNLVSPKTLAVRTHHCPHCGLILDRDENAANNILALALSAAHTTSAAQAADAGRPVRAAFNGGVTRHSSRNTGAAKRSDGGGAMPPHQTRAVSRRPKGGERSHGKINAIPATGGRSPTAKGQ